ncbi:MAG TPA: hypothetical protein VK904_03285 [Miltoncostaeaceae bacterium]|nr:hypothetical protein [Miltoncostaeaceae bacterium]
MPLWGWALVGLAAFVVAGLLVTLALGLAGAPGDAARRLGQRVTLRRHVYRGTQLPEEVPEGVDEPGAEDPPGRG